MLIASAALSVGSSSRHTLANLARAAVRELASGRPAEVEPECGVAQGRSLALELLLPPDATRSPSSG